MPILRSLPPWPNPQESIGRQIPSSRVGRRTVWWPRGPALETFEKSIQPEIENILKVVDLGHADLFIRLYMIGRKPESANPIVMVCCTNSKARDAAESSIRESGLLVGHKGFGLGGAALPLEHPTPVRRLCADNQDQNLLDVNSESVTVDIPSQPSSTVVGLPFRPRSDRVPHPPVNTSAMDNSLPFIVDILPSATEYNSNSGLLIFASSTEPLIGRRIFASANSDYASHPYATAGVVIQVGQNFYQLTAGHLFEENSKLFDEEKSQMNLDECHYDGQSDDDEQDSDYESERTGHGSATPEDARSSLSGSTDEEITHNYKTNMHRDLHPIFDRQQESGDVPTLDRMQSHIETNSRALSSISKPGPRFPIGYLFPGISFQAPMDYAIIAISNDSVDKVKQTINRNIRPSRRVKNIAEIGHEECNIIVATHSSTIEGILIPGIVTYRNCRAQFERLIQVKLGSPILEGDSGSPVFDKLTGNLYGHIIMGVAGTKVAYMTQAVDIFRDIESRLGKPVKIVTRESIRGTRTPRSAHALSSRTGTAVSSAGSHNSAKSFISHPSTNPSSPFTSTGKKNNAGSLSFENCHVSLSQAASSHKGGCSILSGSSASRSGSSMYPGFSASSMLTSSFACFTPPRLPCEFVGYARCDETFALDDVDGWIEHIVSEHLEYHLPKKVICWFCDNWIFDYKEVGDRRMNFDQRMWHIRSHILEEGYTADSMRPDYFLNEHLQKYQLISDQIYHTVRRFTEVPQGHQIPTPGDVPLEREENFMYNNPKADERKQRKRQKGKELRE